MFWCFDSFLITKAIWDWGELFGIHGKAMESLEIWRTKALKSFAISKSRMQGGEAKRNLPWSIFYDSHVSHFWSTSRSPFSTCYIPFQSSGSQESNALNGMQFWVEMKELQPLEVNYSKLKEAFGKSVAKSPFCCEMISQPFCTVWWISSWSCPIYATSWKLRTSRWKPTSQPCENNLLLRSDFAALFVCLRNLADIIFSCEMVPSASRYLWSTHWDIFLQIFVIFVV